MYITVGIEEIIRDWMESRAGDYLARDYGAEYDPEDLAMMGIDIDDIIPYGIDYQNEQVRIGDV